MMANVVNDVNMLQRDYRSEVASNGYTVVEGALTTYEIQTLRKTLLHYFRHGDFIYLYGAKLRPDAFNAPGLKDILWLLKKETIAAAIKQIAGENVKFTHHSDVHLNLAGGWHKDNYGCDDFAVRGDNELYGVYKVALYLQDHLDSNYALKVRKSSHKTRSTTEGDVIAINTRAGDAIIFDCRISHMGQQDAMPATAAGRFYLRHIMGLAQSDQSRYKLRHWYRRLTGIPDRLSIFFAYGKCNSFTEEHIAGNVRRQNEQMGIQRAAPCQEIITNLQVVGIGF